MSFPRNRRSTIGTTNNFHNHYGSNPNPNYSLHSIATSSYHRDRPFADSDAGVGPPPTKKRKSWSDRETAPPPPPPPPPPPAESSRNTSAEPFMSRDEIESLSPSRKDGIDRLLETHLRYSYCAYLQSLGTGLELPQTTIGTAIVLCHRFFLRRSHASHDRFLIATAALFLAAKSEETPCLLNTVLRASCEICQKQNFDFYPYMFYSEWFEQYRERVTEAEQMILTTLDFKLEVQHPYVPLTSVLNKLGLSQTVLLNLAWNLISEGVFLHENNVLSYWDNVSYGTRYDMIIKQIDTGSVSRATNIASDRKSYLLRSSLWLQFKPHHIAAGATFLAARYINFDLSYYQSIWHEFQTTPYILQDVVQQLMELF